MKIVIVSYLNFKNIAGIERVLISFSKFMESKGHNIYFVSLVHGDIKYPITDEFKNKNVIRLNYKINNVVRNLMYLMGIDDSSYYKALKETFNNINQPDLILVLYCETLSDILPNVKMALKETTKNAKVVSWIHCTIINHSSYLKSKLKSSIRKFREPRLLRSADAHLAISNGMKDQILTLDPSAKVYTVFNPLEPYNGGLILRSKIPTFLYVGRIKYRGKNLSFMFNGLSKVKKDWKLIIVGTGSDEDKLKNLADSLGISQKIEWRGFKKNPYENLNEGVTALLLTSRSEAFGMVLAEANQRGIPFISSDCVGPSDIVIPGVNGYLYPEGEMDAFVKVVNDVIDGKLGFGTPEEIAKTAERFSGERVNENILKVLEEIISN